MIDVIGEALIDVYVDDSNASLHPGGGPFNTAVALARLGVPIAFRGALSADVFGDKLDHALDEAGVLAGGRQRVDLPTPIAIVHVVGRDAEYSFHFRETALEVIADSLEPLESATATFVGSLALTLEPSGSAVEAYAMEAASRSALVIDPNVRPALLGALDGYRDRLNRLASVAAIVKLSRADAEALYPASPLGDVATRLLGLGAGCVVVTDGANGAAAWTPTATAACISPAVRVVDTVGAGDAFTAGLLAFLARAGALTPNEIAALDNEILAAALQYGAATGAAQCQRASAWGPTDSDVRSLLAELNAATAEEKEVVAWQLSSSAG